PDTATPELSPLSLHDALPICGNRLAKTFRLPHHPQIVFQREYLAQADAKDGLAVGEDHTHGRRPRVRRSGRFLAFIFLQRAPAHGFPQRTLPALKSVLVYHHSYPMMFFV